MLLALSTVMGIAYVFGINVNVSCSGTQLTTTALSSLAASHSPSTSPLVDCELLRSLALVC